MGGKKKVFLKITYGIINFPYLKSLRKRMMYTTPDSPSQKLPKFHEFVYYLGVATFVSMKYVLFTNIMQRQSINVAI
jgi:hypothetical protein